MGPDAGKLERHPSLDERFDPAIRIVEHDPDWATQARAELGRLAEALPRVAVRLEHVGSTAVPGLAAKPILDLQMSLIAIEPRDDGDLGPRENCFLRLSISAIPVRG